MLRPSENFSDLEATGVGYARHRNQPKRGERDVYSTCHDDTAFGAVRATILKAPLAKCPSPLDERFSAAPDRRMISSALHAMGLDQHKRFRRYHRVLSHASWSSVKASRLLLGLLVEMFVADGDPLVVGIDETLERRWGKKISAKGVYRDPVRSTHENVVKSSVH
jgi:DDE superfamily endonuclease